MVVRSCADWKSVLMDTLRTHRRKDLKAERCRVPSCWMLRCLLGAVGKGYSCEEDVAAADLTIEDDVLDMFEYGDPF